MYAESLVKRKLGSEGRKSQRKIFEKARLCTFEVVAQGTKSSPHAAVYTIQNKRLVIPEEGKQDR